MEGGNERRVATPQPLEPSSSIHYRPPMCMRLLSGHFPRSAVYDRGEFWLQQPNLPANSLGSRGMSARFTNKRHMDRIFSLFFVVTVSSSIPELVFYGSYDPMGA